MNDKTLDVFNKFLVIQFGGKRKKWKTLFHNGLIFPPPYVPHKVPLMYKGEKVTISEIAEEFAMIYVKYLDTDYIKNKLFNKNFWNDWKKLLDPDSPIKTFEDIDFSEYHDIHHELKKCKTEEEKNKEKIEKDKLDQKYKIVFVDGKEQEIGSYRVEPPGIFLGRGSNPLIGKIKRRLYPEDFTINISEDVAIPETPKGHSWGEIVHNRDVEWIASWIDPVTDKMKYIWLSSSSDFKANNDYKKFELARKLKRRMKKITEANTMNLESNDLKVKQLATALYFIDKLAIRVGNEKGADEADTVGCTTLRLEHITLDGNILTLDFLGKDSVRYYNSIQVENIVKENVKLFMKDKDQYEQLFDLIDSNDINNYLQTFMKGATAKTIRTMRASNMFQKELFKIDKKYCGKEVTEKELLEEYNRANLKVARYLNHQKNVAKGHREQIEKIDKQIQEQRNKLKKASGKSKNKIKEKIRKLKDKKTLKEELKNLSLGTSKQNYIDSRITVSFMKRHNISPDKLFTKALQKKFKWAFDAGPDFKF
jgi:DNA topoisomerase-1